MSDQEMNEINQQIANYVDKIMDSRKKLRVRGLPKNIPGGLPVMENFPGGVGIKKKAGGLREATARLKAQGLKKGGKKKKFPDLSGDGKVTKKDILMGRGIIKRPGKARKSKS